MLRWGWFSSPPGFSGADLLLGTFVSWRGGFLPPTFSFIQTLLQVLLLPIKAMSLPHLLCFSIHSNKQGFCTGQLIILPKYSYLMDMAAKMPFLKYSYLMDRTAKMTFFINKKWFLLYVYLSVIFSFLSLCYSFLTCRWHPPIRHIVLRFMLPSLTISALLFSPSQLNF